MPLAKFLLGFLIVILAADYVGIWNGFYGPDSRYDVPLHIAGGAWIALLAVYLFEKRPGAAPGDIFAGWKRMLFIAGFVALVGIAWEFYEYFVDVAILKKYALGGQQPAQAFDTLTDLLNDLIGAFLAIISLHFTQKRGL